METAQFEAFFYCSWKVCSKIQKSSYTFGGFRCCRYQGGGFPICLFRSLILPSYLHTCPMLCFSNGIHFHPQWVGKLRMWVEKTTAAKRPQVAAPPKLRLAGQVQWRKELILKSSCVMVCPSGKLGSRLSKGGPTTRFDQKFVGVFFSSRKRLKEVAICWCCWWSLLNMTDSFFSHRPVLLRSWAPSHVAFLALIVIWKKRCYLRTRWQLNNRLNMTKDSPCGF